VPGLPDETAMGAVTLDVADIDTVRAYYERVIGLREVESAQEGVSLGPAGGPPLVRLVSRPDATPRPRRSTGLFHLAILVPDRPALGRTLRRIAEAGAGLTGASDHLVSEALYMRDPEGNGIELYRDRSREDWPRDADGQYDLATLPLDLRDIVSEPGAEAADAEMAQGTRMGHVHLQVSDIPRTRALYEGVLGWDVMADKIPQALFMSAGGYHHHLGCNAWESAGAPPPPEGSAGLRRFDVLLPDADAVAEVAGRASDAGAPVGDDEAGTLVTDPDGNRMLLRAA
jgi:catechol 2,3-dioxygenase